MQDVVHVPFATQLLAAAVALQVVVLLGVLWRGIFGMAAKSGKRPAWLYLPLVLGTGLGAWYGVIQRDLVFGAAQGLALFIGVCLIRSPRTPGGDQAPAGEQGTRRERRAAERAAKQAAGRNKGKDNG